MRIEISVLSFVSAVLVLIPLPRYFRVRNIAAISIGVWLFLLSVIYAIDALQWAGTYRIPSLLWCDITSALITAARLSIPASCLCICIQLERMASFCQTSTYVAKRHRILFECLMCFGLPVIYAALHLIVQSRRFVVYANFGCRPTTYPSIAALFLVWIPPLALSLVMLIFCGITLRRFLFHHVQFSRTRAPLSPTFEAYIRLVSMAILEVICAVGAIVVAMAFNLNSGMAPWADFTRDLTNILSFSSAATPGLTTAVLIFEWAIVVAQCFIFIGLFVVGQEGRSVLHEALQISRRAFTFRNRSSGEDDIVTIRECDLTPVQSLTILFTESSIASACDGHSSSKPSPPPSASLRPLPLDLTDAKRLSLEEGPNSLNPVLMSFDSPSCYSVMTSSHNSLESNFDPHQVILFSTQWPRPPSIAVVRPHRRSSDTYYLHTDDCHSMGLQLQKTSI